MRVIGEVNGPLDIKRFYAHGVSLAWTCTACGHGNVMDLGCWEIDYPYAGPDGPFDWDACCIECDHPEEVRLRIRVLVEVCGG